MHHITVFIQVFAVIVQILCAQTVGVIAGNSVMSGAIWVCFHRYAIHPYIHGRRELEGQIAGEGERNSGCIIGIKLYADISGLIVVGLPGLILYIGDLHTCINTCW